MPLDGMDSRKERATPGRAGPNRNATCAANSTAQDGSASKRRNSVSTETSAASLMAFASGGGAKTSTIAQPTRYGFVDGATGSFQPR